MLLLIIVISVAIAVFIVIRFGIPRAATHFQEVGERSSAETTSSLTEMFIFIEPQKIIYMMIGAWVVALVLTWIFSGIFVFALIVSGGIAMLPKITVNFLRGRRQNLFLKDLPDALFGIANMLKAGSNLSMALETMVAEASGPIADEFGLLLRELRLGVGFDEALDNLYKRMPVQELQLVVAGMKISREVGGSLAEVLARLADTIRRRLEMEGKIKSLTAQGKLQGIVMSALPVFLAYLLFHIEPKAMGRLFTDPIGWGVCAVVIIGEYIGYRFIRKIVTIDV